MLPVEIVPVDGSTLVLRARGSELLILPHHIGELKDAKNPKEFTNYFLTNALLNRPARKLFEAWLRKDKTLWQRIYRTIQQDMEAAASETEAPKAPVKAKPVKQPVVEKVEAKKEQEPSSKEPAKKEAKKPAAKKVAKKAKKTTTKTAKTTPTKTKKKVKKKTAEKVVKKTVKKKATAKKKTATKKKKG